MILKTYQLRCEDRVVATITVPEGCSRDDLRNGYALRWPDRGYCAVQHLNEPFPAGSALILPPRFCLEEKKDKRSNVIGFDARPEPKFQKDQIVVMKSLRRQLPFKILDLVWHEETGEWFYKWNRNNAAAEHMLRGLTKNERGRWDHE